MLVVRNMTEEVDDPSNNLVNKENSVAEPVEYDHQQRVLPQDYTRCGKYKFHGKYKNLIFLQDVYGHVDVDFDSFKENFICDSTLDLSQLETSSVALNAGMEAKITFKRYPDNADGRFVLVGFLDCSVQPDLCSAIIYNAHTMHNDQHFSIVPIMDVLIDWEPRQLPEILESVFDDFSKWAQNAIINKTSLAELFMKQQRKVGNNRRLGTPPPRESLTRASKSRARSRILEMSPTKSEHANRPQAVGGEERHQMEDFQSSSLPCECGPKIKALENTCRALKCSITKLSKEHEAKYSALYAILSNMQSASKHPSSNDVTESASPKKKTKQQARGRGKKSDAAFQPTQPAPTIQQDDALENKLLCLLNKVIKSDPAADQAIPLPYLQQPLQTIPAPHQMGVQVPMAHIPYPMQQTFQYPQMMQPPLMQQQNLQYHPQQGVQQNFHCAQQQQAGSYPTLPLYR